MPIENSQVSDFSDQELSSHTSAECGFDASQQHPIVRKKNRREALLLMGKGLVALGSALFVEPPIARAIPSRQLSGSIGGGSESGEQNPHNSSVPNTPPLVYDEDPLSELRINEIKRLVFPLFFVERYSDKDGKG